MEQSLNIVWKVNRGRRYFHSKVLSVILVPVSLAIVVLSLGMTSLYAFAKRMTLPFVHLRLSDAPFITNLFAILIPVFLSLLLFFLLYKFIPYRKISNFSA